jgi:uncharacterized protein
MPSRSLRSVKVFYPCHPCHSREGIIRFLQRAANELVKELSVCQIVLFGSYATGRWTVASDVDVLIIYRGSPREDAFRVAKRTLKIRGLEPHVYSESEAETIRPTIERMARDGVRIYPP